MADPNMADFYRRVSRIEKARGRGFGFEAEGTLGRSYYSRRPAQRRSVLAPILFILSCVFLLKGVMYHEVGAEAYNSRVASLMSGQGVEQAGAWAMQADPVTILVAQKLDDLLVKLK